MELLKDLTATFVQNAQETFLILNDPSQRIYFLYLGTSVLIAFLIFKSAQGRKISEEKTFLGFLFPKKVWSNPSAWLDLRYFFFHSIFGKVFMVGLSAWAFALAFKLVSGGMSVTEIENGNELSTLSNILIAIGFMVISTLISDFIGWSCHYLQHKSPLLWQFHKVHHSAEVMHPVSNYREHPVDNFFYLTAIGAGYGAILALAVRVFGYAPNAPTVLGVPLVMLAFNLVGYNLRHSHVWLRWPGKLSMIFPSPAHHHVHHSCHPDHIDKNFAFMFPIWDVIFRTYHMPEDGRDVKFGIGDGNADELTSCTRLYWVPVRDAFRVMKAQVRGQAFNMSKPEPVGKDLNAEPIHPGE
ncbi:MAG: sterol desaturase family protein [Sulfitobacter sp.]